ncbi:hypothetical protein L484_012199 [Morus notabilis]|uniref:Uncharacterized protein n=1 Tax=Morus notabilis TaxID=981085 RepID=W9QY63_9ROSA|nr:hypothetical protein L484_012199 [Morus notabilis]
MAAFKRYSPKKPKAPSTSTAAAPRQNSQSTNEANPVPLAIIRQSAIVLYVTPSESGHREEVFSTPRGFPISDDSTATAPVSLPPAASPANAGASQPSPSHPPWSPPNLMKFPVRPGFPSWNSRFPIYPERMKQKSPTRIETEIRAESKKQKMKRYASSSDNCFHPTTGPGASNEAAEVEQSHASTGPLPKRKKQKKTTAPVSSSRVTRSKTKPQAKASETFKREKAKEAFGLNSGKDDTSLFYSDLNRMSGSQ